MDVMLEIMFFVVILSSFVVGGFILLQLCFKSAYQLVSRWISRSKRER